MQNNRVNLRAVEPADIDFIYHLENDIKNWMASEHSVPFSRYAIEQYVLSIEQDIFVQGQLRLIIESNDTSSKKDIGSIELFDADPLHRRAGIGIYIIAGEQQKGYASAALKLMIDYCFKTLGLHQIFCNIAEDNEASIKLFKKHGFQVIGLKKDWRFNNNSWKNEYLLQLINE